MLQRRLAAPGVRRSVPGPHDRIAPAQRSIVPADAPAVGYRLCGIGPAASTLLGGHVSEVWPGLDADRRPRLPNARCGSGNFAL